MRAAEHSRFPDRSTLRLRFIRMQLLAALLLMGCAAAAQSVHDWSRPDCTIFSDERYGKSDQNTFDMIVPKAAEPRSLVIYIHGGGFTQGDKSDPFRTRSGDIGFFLKTKVAFASLGYRFASTTDSMGVAVCLQDIRAALQYIRHHAARYNINKESIACYGSSAGAGSSLYLAFHDDVALNNDTSIFGESTRIRCAGALSTQATYDVFRWIDFIPGMDSAVAKAKDATYDAAAKFYGYSTYRSFEPHRAQVTRELDMLEMISPDDPPVYIMNLQQEIIPRNIDAIEHHRAHALILSDYLERKGVAHEVYVYSDTVRSETDIRHPVSAFLVSHLQR
jgi:hypothetical protein